MVFRLICFPPANRWHSVEWATPMFLISPQPMSPVFVCPVSVIISDLHFSTCPPDVLGIPEVNAPPICGLLYPRKQRRQWASVVELTVQLLKVSIHINILISWCCHGYYSRGGGLCDVIVMLGLASDRNGNPLRARWSHLGLALHGADEDHDSVDLSCWDTSIMLGFGIHHGSLFTGLSELHQLYFFWYIYLGPLLCVPHTCTICYLYMNYVYI